MKNQLLKSPTFSAWAISVLFAILFIGVMPSLYPIGDSVVTVELSSHSHPHIRSAHLLLDTLYWTVLQVVNLLSVEIPPFVVIQLVNIMFGLSAAWLTRRIAVHLGATLLGSNLCHVLFLSSFVFVLHSTTAETGIIPTGITLLGLYLALRSKTFIWRSIAIGAWVGGVACSLNHAFTFPLLLACLTKDDSRGETSYRLIATTLWTMIAGLTLFLLVGIIDGSVSSPSSFVTWITSHEDEKLGTGAFLGVKSFLRNFVGWVVGVADCREFTAYLRILLKGDLVMSPSLSSTIAFFVSCLTLSLLLIFQVGFFKREKRIALGFTLSTLLNFVFLLNWLGSESQYWMVNLALLYAFSCSELKWSGWKEKTTVGLLAVFSTILFTFSFRPNTVSLFFPSGSIDDRRARDWTTLIPPNSIVLNDGVIAVDLLPIHSDTAIEVKNFARSFPLPGSAEYRWHGTYSNLLVHYCDSLLREGNNVYATSLGAETIHPGSTAVWEIVRTVYNVERAGVRRSMVRSFDLIKFPDSTAAPYGIVQLKLKSAQR